MEISKLFDNILDLPGIEGVCLFGPEGQMYVNRLPAFLSNELFADAQRRIVAMYETMDENFLPCDDYMLRFSERWLLLRRTEKQVLLVLGGDKANLASTRMVTNMTMKHLTPTVIASLAAAARSGAVTTATVAVAASATSLPTSSPPPAVASTALTPGPTAGISGATGMEAAATATKPVRMYRGRAY
jgi:hypothetical protein